METSAKGVFDHVEYQGSLLGLGLTVIYFKDGSTFVLKGQLNIPVKKGTKIKVIQYDNLLSVSGKIEILSNKS